MTPSSTSTNGLEGRIVSGDELLEGVGAQGWYQRRLLWLFVLPVCFLLPVIYLSVLMQVATPDHWCRVPGRPDSVPLDQWRQRTVPRRRLPDGSTAHSQCLMFSAALTNATNDWRNTTHDTVAAPAESSNQTANVTACQFGWEFDRSDFSETAVSAFQWVCDDSQQITRLLTASSVGNLLGSIVFGWLADRVGRRLVFFLLTVLQPLVIVAGVLPAQPTVFIVMRFFAALCYPVMYQLVFTIGMEFTCISRRTCYAVVVSIAFTLGMSALPLVAYLMDDWVHLGLASALLSLLILPCFWLVDESPRWLLSRGRVTDAAAVLRRVAAANGVLPCTVERLLGTTSGADCQPAVPSPLKLLSGRRLRLKTAILTACWAINVIMYYGLMLNFSDMSGNIFLNFFLLSVVELPSNVLALYVCDRFGRRPTQLLFFTGSGLSLAAVIPLQYVTGTGGAITALLMLGKFCTSLTFVVLYLQSAELYPTCVRSMAIGLSSLVGIGAGIFTPYILRLGVLSPSYPFIVMGGLGIIGALCVAQLPETRGRPLPETLEDAEHY